MSETKDNNPVHVKWPVVLVAVASAALGSVSGLYITINFAPEVFQEVAAPDRFTGTQGARTQEQLDELAIEFKSMASQLRALEIMVARLPPSELTESVAVLRTKVDAAAEDIRQLAADLRAHRQGHQK